MTNVTIKATDDTVDIAIDKGNGEAPEEYNFAYPGLVTGCELRDILESCGVAVDFQYDEGDGE